MTHHQRFPYKRIEHVKVEERFNNVDVEGLKERAAMEAQAAKISIGTFNLFKPKPDTEISCFTLALSKSIPKRDLYAKLRLAFPDEWHGAKTDSVEVTRSLFIRFNRPLPLYEIRRRLRDNLEDVLSS